MEALFGPRRFAGFGPSRFATSNTPAPLSAIQARQPGKLRQRLRAKCPRRPGVYGMVDRRGKLIYVGKAKCLRTRLMSYFRVASRDEKAGRIIANTRAIVWENASSEFAALLRELELIRLWQPSYNVQGQPGWRRPTYVCLGRKPAPYLFATKNPPADVLATYGPIRGSSRIGDAVRRLNDVFQLRDCERSQKMHFADQGELFPVIRVAGCLRHEIGTCSGPCAAGVTRSSYRRQVRSVRDFLEGKDTSTIRHIERDMVAAANARAYERAAALRDKREDLNWICERMSWLQSTRREHTFIYPVTGYDEQTLWYLVHCARVMATIAAPHDAASRRIALKAIETVFGNDSHDDMTLPPDEVDCVFLVAAWFRKHECERKRWLTPSDALDQCRAHTSIAPVCKRAG